MFVGGFLLFAAAIVALTGLWMSPHGDTVAEGTQYVRDVIVVYARNSATATIILSALAAFLLYPSRRPRMPKRDWAVGLLIGLLICGSLYQLWWLRSIN
jgi:hypothetical protein